MTTKRGPWTIHESRQIYDNPWIEVNEHQVTQPDGSPSIYGVMSPKFIALGVLPIFEDGSTVLVGQYRFAPDRYSWELPEGGGRLDADPLESAKRELAEETGYRATQWETFLELDMSNSVTDEASIAYLAWDLEPGKTDLDSSEADLVSERVSFQQALSRAMSGEIRDAFTVVMLGKAYYMWKERQLPEPLQRILDHA